jgi:hypothetical protein
MSENPNIQEAKKSLKAHIKFLKSLNDHIAKAEEPFLSRSMFAAWCIDKYLNEQLKNDIEEAMKNGN